MEYFRHIDYDKNINNICLIFEFLYNSITIKNGQENVIKKFIVDKYNDYCKDSPRLHLIHQEPSEYNSDIKVNSALVDTSYLETRPKMFWDNINPFNKKGDEIKYVLILLRHNTLTEVYGNDRVEKLIYWMGWGIPKGDIDLPKISRKNLPKAIETFKQIYPYMLFKNQTVQTYSEYILKDKNNKIYEIIKNIPFH